MATLDDILNGIRNVPDAISSAPINTNTLSQPSTLSFIGADVAAARRLGPRRTDNGRTRCALQCDVCIRRQPDRHRQCVACHLGMVPASPPYADRSFSNGPVWAQDLAQSLGLPALKPSLAGGTDFAYGGAETGQTPVHTLNATDLTSQYSQFLTQVPNPQAGALYAVWIGSNDVLDIANDSSLTPDQQQADVGAAVQNEMSVINGLVSHGAQNLLVLNVPDIGKTPYETARGPTVAQSATSLASLYDSDLAAALQPLEASGALKVDLVDTFTALNQVRADPGAFGFTNVTDPVWTGNLTDSNSGTLRATGAAQNQFLYFDSLHPTAAAHAQLASGIAAGLTAVA